MVSVIIPTYNRGKLLVRAVNSVLTQTYSDLELIIVDDGSTDNTGDAIKAIDDPRIKYIYQNNAGACAARNNGIDHARGEYIAFQDSDDVWHTDKLEKQIKILESSDANLVFCCMAEISEGKINGKIGDIFKPGICASSELLLGGSTQTLCADSNVFKSERFDISMPRLQDFEILLRIQKKYKLYYYQEPLVDYYMQSDSISMNPEKLLKAWRLILDKHNDFKSIYKKSLERPALGILNAAFITDDASLKRELISMAFNLKKSPKVLLKALLIQNKGLYKTLASLHKKLLKKNRGGGQWYSINCKSLPSTFYYSPVCKHVEAA